MSDLAVSFVGETIVLGPDEDLTFGRDADLVIDENPYLHRKLGLIERRAGVWWLTNVGDMIPLEVRDRESRSVLVIASGRAVALSFPKSFVQFEAGGLRYELELYSDAVGAKPAEPEPHDDDGATIGLNQVPLTDDQKRILLVLCEGPLRDPAVDVTIPPSRQGALRLGWTLKAYGRKLDNVCDRLSRAGVRGLRGDQAGIAKDRRLALAEYALAVRLVTAEDLHLLDDLAAADH